ncbi:MAG TPA: helix-turn-helix transcriptional regulator [Rhizomicrobium sp.]|nr:helix-turn-helix transcriptional regulator [Rhizomicrobium sp.]
MTEQGKTLSNVAKDVNAGQTPDAMRGIQFKVARLLLGGLDQAEVAKATEISRGTLQDIENGTGNPSWATVKTLVDFYQSRKIRFVNEGGSFGVILDAPEAASPPRVLRRRRGQPRTPE